MPVNYTGSICREYLALYQSCSPSSNGRVPENIYVPDFVDQTSAERNVDRMFNYVNIVTVNNDACRTALLPFACLHFFGLCDPSSNSIVLPTRSQCRVIKKETCVEEWNFAETLGPVFSDRFPKCRRLQESSLAPTTTCSEFKLYHVLIIICIIFCRWQ